MDVEVSEIISPADAMWRFLPDKQKYLAAGKTVADALRVVVDFSGANPQTILDYGCGHGRVLRWLRAYWPNARLGAADVTSNQIDFCAKTFSATPILLDKPFSQIQIDAKYDLIWLGSIFTHLDEKSWGELMQLLKRTVSRNGIVCFSFAGRSVYEMIKRRDRGAILSAESEESVVALLASYESSGFGFLGQTTSNGGDWGRSIVTPNWALNFCLEAGATIVFYSEKAYARRQDIIALKFE